MPTNFLYLFFLRTYFIGFIQISFFSSLSVFFLFSYLMEKLRILILRSHCTPSAFSRIFRYIRLPCCFSVIVTDDKGYINHWLGSFLTIPPKSTTGENLFSLTSYFVPLFFLSSGYDDSYHIICTSVSPK